MSFYRSILAAVAAAALIAPAFAEDAATTSTEGTSATMQQSADQSTSTEQTKINLNKATAKDLMKVKGLNAKNARAIVAYRKKHGEFKSTDDLGNVKGFKSMKPDTMKEIQDQVTVE